MIFPQFFHPPIDGNLNYCIIFGIAISTTLNILTFIIIYICVRINLFVLDTHNRYSQITLHSVWTNFYFHQGERDHFFTSSPTSGISRLLKSFINLRVKKLSFIIILFAFPSLTVSEVEHHFTSLLTILVAVHVL